MGTINYLDETGTTRLANHLKLNTLTGLLSGGEIGEDIDTEAVSVSTLPYDFYQGSAVVVGNEIHVLGSGYYNSGYPNATSHYKWNGSSWSEVSTLPYNFFTGSAVVLNGEIHILGSSNSGNYTKHYKWNGSSWSEVSTLPYNFYQGSAVVLNGEIHILGGNGDYTKHYKWNGSSWSEVSTLPYDFFCGSAVVVGGEIHILGGTDNYLNHYKWNGSSWTEVTEFSMFPYNFYQGSAVVLNNEIHILGTISSGSTSHYKWDGSSWTSVSTLPYSFYDGSAVVLNNEIHILGCGDSGNETSHYRVEKITPIPGWLPIYDEQDPSTLLFYFQVANVEGLSESDIVIVSFDPSEMSTTDLPNLAKSQIYCLAQHDGSLDFIAYKLPEFDISLNAVIQGGTVS